MKRLRVRHIEGAAVLGFFLFIVFVLKCCLLSPVVCLGYKKTSWLPPKEVFIAGFIV
jgi:hypothetical protein